MAGPLSIAIVDDDVWRRDAMARVLDEHPSIHVEFVVDQDEAVRSPAARWDGIDLVLVDVFDELAPGEVGTDLYSGMTALHHLRKLPPRTLAISPHSGHPIVQLRLWQSEPDWVYLRWEVNSVEALLEAVLQPEEEHRPQRPSERILAMYGVEKAKTNDAVQMYEGSDLYPQLRPGLGQKHLRISRRAFGRFRRAAADLGFVKTASSAASLDRHAPNWRDVRDYLLTLLGRMGASPTEDDERP